MGWLKQHMEEFVKPVLGFIPTEPLKFFSPAEMVVIKNTWNSVKREAKGRTILLAGRDVFLFEILARRENYPTAFRPDISRQTVTHESFDVGFGDLLLFDTGFAGSIPINLRIKRFKLISFVERNSLKHQVFPNLGWARTLALKIESTPKYWESARLNYPAAWEIRQFHSKLDEFELAARLTLTIYKDSTRRTPCLSVPRLRKRSVVFGDF